MARHIVPNANIVVKVLSNGFVLRVELRK